MEKNKILIPTIVAVLTLIILTFAATYAYFNVTAINNFGTKTIEASTPDVGSVALSTGSNLYLNLTRSNMTQANVGTYYAIADSSGIATTTETTVNIGTATVTGEGTFTCTYDLKAEYEGTLKSALTTNNIAILTINGTDYDVYSTNFPFVISGTMTGLTSVASQNITAQFRFVNTSSVQNELKNKNITITFSVANFDCTATE